MKSQALIAMILLAGLQASCKVVNTHVFKLTSTPAIGVEAEVKIATSKGYLFLPLAQLDEKEREILQGIRPFQCLSIRSSEPFDMNNREVRFTDFQMKKLPESDPECRKVKVTTRIYAN